MTKQDIRARATSLRDVLNTTVNVTVHRYPADYHTPKYAGCWYVDIELPFVETLKYEQIQRIVAHLGTTCINFQSANEHGYYGDVDNIVRLWACWLP